MLKGFIGIAAFVLTFGFSVSLVGLLFGFSVPGVSTYDANNARVSHQITNFLRSDVRNGTSRDRKIRRQLSESYSRGEHSYLTSYAGSVENYFNASSSMNDAFMPADLRYAWREHMDAWSDHVKLLQQAESSGQNLKDCCDGAFFVRYKNGVNKINSTWEQVLRIADRYGADTSGMR